MFYEFSDSAILVMLHNLCKNCLLIRWGLQAKPRFGLDQETRRNTWFIRCIFTHYTKVAIITLNSYIKFIQFRSGNAAYVVLYKVANRQLPRVILILYDDTVTISWQDEIKEEFRLCTTIIHPRFHRFQRDFWGYESLSFNLAAC